MAASQTVVLRLTRAQKHRSKKLQSRCQQLQTPLAGKKMYRQQSKDRTRQLEKYKRMARGR